MVALIRMHENTNEALIHMILSERLVLVPTTPGTLGRKKYYRL